MNTFSYSSRSSELAQQHVKIYKNYSFNFILSLLISITFQVPMIGGLKLLHSYTKAGKKKQF